MSTCTSATPPCDRLPDAEPVIEGAGGVALQLTCFEPHQQIRGAIVLVHGFFVWSAVHRHVAALLAAQGWRVVQLDLRGHGRSGGRRAYVERFEDYVEDLHRVTAFARDGASTLPTVVVGHSQGATAALALALDHHAPPLDGLVLVAPWLALQQPPSRWTGGLARLLSRLWPTLSLPAPFDPALATRNPVAAQQFLTAPLVHRRITPRWYVEATQAQRRLQLDAARLEVPTLVQLAGDDRIVDNDATLQLAATCPQGTVEVRTYPGLRHDLFLEPEHSSVLDDLQRWVEARLS